MGHNVLVQKHRREAVEACIFHVLACDRLSRVPPPSIIITHASAGWRHTQLTMAPHTGFDTDQIKDKARKDLLYLLEGVSKALFLPLIPSSIHQLTYAEGPWKEESGD